MKPKSILKRPPIGGNLRLAQINEGRHFSLNQWTESNLVSPLAPSLI
jgi:hypothetical protein